MDDREFILLQQQQKPKIWNKKEGKQYISILKTLLTMIIIITKYIYTIKNIF